MKEEINYFEEENELIRRTFNLEEILSFQLEHDVQIIRGGDYQYYCYIDRGVYSTALLPLSAITSGIKIYMTERKTNSSRSVGWM